jgi:hypothetical protein
MSRKFLPALIFTCLSLTVPLLALGGDETKSGASKRQAKKLSIKVTPWGPSHADVDAARQRARTSEVVQRELNGAKFREVGFEYLYDESETKNQTSRTPTRFRIVYYNYSTDLALIVESNFAGTEPVTAHWENVVPGVGGDELSAAYQVAAQDTGVANMRKGGSAEFYAAMPPTTVVNGERLVNIGLMDQKTGVNTIIGVSFKNNSVHRYENNAPPTSAATPDACGIANAGQAPTAPGIAGQATLTVSDTGGNPIWEMLIVRPSASSGANFERSGLEIRDVRYKGKSVLKRGHVPILNVKYNGGCGPFRDWQYSEGYFNAPDAGASDLAPGVRLLAPGQVATTSIETRNDTGNYRGVAIYVQDVGLGQEVVMVTEMEAGWYRYIMEWRFAPNGTIRPRFGFASTVDSCVCLQRTHHVYWRLDFDVAGPNNRAYLMDRGRRYQQLIQTESALFKRTQTSRSIMIQSAAGDEAYQIVPGTNDGKVLDDLGNMVDTFGAGDFWLMRFKGTADSPLELDDENGGVYPAANLAPWVNGEALVNQDLVVWYAAHQVRQDDSSRLAAPQVIAGQHIVGPVLRPIRW